MPSASTTEMPLRLSSGSSGIRTPWKSWLVSLAPLSENCPTDIFSSRGIPGFHDNGPLHLPERSIRPQDKAAWREEARDWESGRFGAVLTWVAYNVSPVKAR